MLRRDRRASEDSDSGAEEEAQEQGQQQQEEGKEGEAGEKKDEEQQQQKKQRRKAPVFTENHLIGANGLSLVHDSFPDGCGFRGRGYEAKDLDRLIGNYRQWAYNLFPNLAFEDLLMRVEKMGSKAAVRGYLTELRTRERESYIKKRYQDTTNVRSPQATVPVSDTEVESELEVQHAASTTTQPPAPIQLNYEDSHATAPQTASYYDQYDEDEEELQFDEDEMAMALQQTPVDPAFS